MAFFTEFFTRPRHQGDTQAWLALALLDGGSSSDRIGSGIKPADFPRIARQAVRRRAF